MSKDTILEHPDVHSFWTNGIRITPVTKTINAHRWSFAIECTGSSGYDGGLVPSRKTKKATIALRNAYITFLKTQGWKEVTDE